MTPRPHRLVAVLCLAALVVGCGVVYRAATRGIGNSGVFCTGRRGALEPAELEWGRTAWRYFANNTEPGTGLVNGADGYRVVTMWQVGDYVAALVAARGLDLIDQRDFDLRVSALLNFLNTMPLFADRLPNKAYSTSSGEMVDYDNRPGGSGWSAVDLGRLLVWLQTLAARYPQHAEYVDRAVLRWSFCDVIDRCGTLYGGVQAGDRVEIYQEGRLGYEQYAARGFQAWGFDTRVAADPQPAVEVEILDVPLLVDTRDRRISGVLAPLVTLPFVLDGLEFDWARDPAGVDTGARARADAVYAVQARRYEREGTITARTDHQLNHPPYMVYDAIYVDGYPWNTVTADGTRVPEYALVSLRAAIGMWALWPSAYTDTLFAAVGSLYDPQRGWFEGRGERTGAVEETVTATTNAVVLEAVLHKADGTLFRAPGRDGYAADRLRDEFTRPGHCFPGEREACE